MPLQSLSGIATNVSLGSQLAYAPTAQYGPVGVQQHLANFRINNRPVRFKVTDSASISEGDRVVVAGSAKQGTLEAFALRNLTTGAIHHNPYQFPLYAGIAGLVLSLPMIFILIGFLTAPIAGWIIWRALQIKNAVALVNSAPIGETAAA